MNTEDSEFERIEREQAMRGVPDAIHHTDTNESLEYITGWNDCRQAMLEEQPAQQEPVGEVSGHDWSTGLLYRDLEPGAPLYTSPPAQRTWVGLTEEEKTELRRKHYPLPLLLMDATEAKLKEKNT